MHPQRSLLLACLAGALPILAQNDTTNEQSTPNPGSDDCHIYHAFIFRGSKKPYRGRPSPFVDAICDRLDDTCDYEDTVYPAELSPQAGGEPGEICKSMTAGARIGQNQLHEYADRCPDAQLIRVGYSQGALVLFDVLGGGGAEIYNCTQETTPALDSSTSPGSNIVAAINFGAIRYTANQTFNHGSGAAYDSGLPRSGRQLADLQEWSPILRACCHFEDPVCATASGMVLEQHWKYFDEHLEEGAEWVMATARNETAREAVSGQTEGRASGTGGAAANGTASGESGASGDGDASAGSGTPAGKEDGNEEGGSDENSAAGIVDGSLPTLVLGALAMLLVGR